MVKKNKNGARSDAIALAEELGCSRRTVHRLLQTLSMAGVPWYYDEKLRAYRVRAGYRFPLLEIGTTGSSGASAKENEMAEIIEQLIRDGEALSTSLNKFLTTLKNSDLATD